MPSSLQSVRRVALAAILSLFAFTVAFPAQPAAEPGKTSRGAGSATDELVQLTPFEVQADADKSYGALNSNSLTGFRVPLEKLPMTAEILDQTFMKDIGAGRDVYEMIQTFSAGAGFSPFDAGGTAGSSQPLDRQGNANSLRGLSAPSAKRDGLLDANEFGTGLSTSFDVERVEIINGPQALLFGNGGGGGVLNILSKQARFGRRPFTELMFQTDSAGHKMGQIDFSAGTDRFAVRLAAVDQTTGSRRADLGGPLRGYYAQIAFKLRNTTFRFMSDYTDYDEQLPNYPTLTARSTALDGRNGQRLTWLIATNQIGASATGASGAGVLLNGKVNWDNVNSFAGQWAGDRRKAAYDAFTAESVWTRWLSTQLSLAYAAQDHQLSRAGVALYAPDATANPLGVWAMGLTGNPASVDTNRQWAKAIRFSALFTNDLFQGRAKSQTTIGADFMRRDNSSMGYAYYRADADGNLVRTNGVRSVVPAQVWSVASGPVQYSVFKRFVDRVSLNGVNYVRSLINPVDHALITPLNPIGTASTTGTYNIRHFLNKGLFGANYTQWLDGRLSTIVGVRTTKYHQEIADGTTRAGTAITDLGNTSVNVGAVWQATKGLSPYVQYSDSYAPPNNSAFDPYGTPPKVAHSQGKEVGVKITNAARTLSGSLALYQVDSKDEQALVPAGLLDAINPSGLNGGRAGTAPSTTIAVNRKSQGAQLSLTANPASNWRMRLSTAYVAGTIGTTKTYAQLYNDRFFQNTQGQVTYRDGSTVFVNPLFDARTPVATPTTAGAVPLTLAMLGSPTSPYYANPVAVSGAINAGSAAATVLRVIDPVRGPILTGERGLPITAQQINPGFPVPGEIVAVRSGEATTGFPKYSVNFTNVYTVGEGFAKGIRVGGTIGLGWKNTWYYYDPNGVSAVRPRIPLYKNTLARFDLIAGYENRFRRVTYSTQINVNNLFNRYRVALLPNPTAGWAGPNDATFDQQPRVYRWTNTISF